MNSPTYLINNTTLNYKNEVLTVNENDIVHLFKEFGLRRAKQFIKML